MTTSVWLAAALLLFASLYLGMGFTLVALMFPGALATTDATNFPQRFGDPVRRAVAFFGVVSVLMLLGGGWLTARDWDHGARRLLPLVFALLVLLATAFTVLAILPVNRALSRQVADPGAFSRLLARWIRLNTVRYVFWVFEWLALALWLVAVAT